MTTIASLLAQSAYVQPRKGVRWREKGERKSVRERERVKEREGGRESCYDTPAGDRRFCSREDGLG